jgi:preprotein translocase subunit SecF
MQLIKQGNNYDIIGKRRIAAIASAVAVTVSVLIAVVGSLVDTPVSPKYGVDFAGGTEIHLKVAQGVTIEQLRAGLGKVGLNDDSVQKFGGSGLEYLVRVESVNFGAAEFFTKVEAQLKADYGEETWVRFEWDPEQSIRMSAKANRTISPEEVEGKLKALNKDVTVEESKVEHDALIISFPGVTDAVKNSLAGALGDDQFSVLSVEMVGPSVGAELRRKGLLSILFSLALILVYVAFRFDLSFAPGAVAALGHDVAITIGVFCLLGREFTLPTIGALLTIVGYSLNDTIVVYDRIRENLIRFPRRDLGELINVSLNETLSRTVLTSITTLAAVLAMMVFGGPIIADFSLALLIGVVVGTYSSIFVASPMILFLQRWIPVETPVDEDAESALRAR